MAAQVSHSRQSLVDNVCLDAINFPTTGSRSKLFNHKLGAYCRQLADVETTKRVFRSTPGSSSVLLLESRNGTDFQDVPCATIDVAKKHLTINAQDPGLRYLFILADSSFKPLDCSKELFLLLASYHRVMPQFLDIILDFGQLSRQESPTQFHSKTTSFHHESFLNPLEAKRHRIPELGRSGLEIRVCYNLWSVEQAGKNWFFRQTGMYQSFDVETGRCFTTNVKANKVMRDRISSVAKDRVKPWSGQVPDPVATFASSLEAHLIVLEWCSENWRQYLRSLEVKLEAFLIKMKNIMVESIEIDTKELRRGAFFPVSAPASPVASRQSAGNGTMTGRSLPRGGTGPRMASIASTITLPPASPSPAASQRTPPNLAAAAAVSSAAASYDETSSEEDEPFVDIKEFDFSTVQALSGIAARFEDANMVMDLNSDVVLGLQEYYGSLLSNPNFPDSLKEGCGVALAEFQHRARSCIRSLEISQRRTRALIKRSEDAKHLIDGIIQVRNFGLSSLFAENARASAARMEGLTIRTQESTQEMQTLTVAMNDMAQKTVLSTLSMQKSTLSMHFITFATFTFLPGTFVATFLGSGMWQWDDQDPSQQFPTWKPEYFNMFAKLCFPMMAAVILAWVVFYFWTRRRMDLDRTEKVADEEKALGGPGMGLGSKLLGSGAGSGVSTQALSGS